MRIVSASFFYKNDQPGGLGVTFGPPGFTPSELDTLFRGDTVREYFRASDEHLGTRIVADYFRQLDGIARDAKLRPLPLHVAMIAALNIMWLTERGFLAQDEFNGTQFAQMD